MIRENNYSKSRMNSQIGSPEAFSSQKCQTCDLFLGKTLERHHPVDHPRSASQLNTSLLDFFVNDAQASQKTVLVRSSKSLVE